MRIAFKKHPCYPEWSVSILKSKLLQEVCCSFKLDIPCCVRAPRLGMQSDQRVPVSGGQHKVATPECCSILYICQHCLVHLGDLGECSHLGFVPIQVNVTQTEAGRNVF